MNISLKKQQHLDLMKTLGLNGSTVSERTVNYCFKAAPYSGFLSFFFKKKGKKLRDVRRNIICCLGVSAVEDPESCRQKEVLFWSFSHAHVMAKAAVCISTWH